MSQTLDLFDRPVAAGPYGDLPGHRGVSTSIAAAESMKPRAAILRDKCMAALEAQGPMTADECARFLGESVLSIRPRFTEMNIIWVIEDTGTRRKNDSGRNAIVWRAR